MINDDELESLIRQQHAHKRFLKTQSRLLQQELDIEDELLEQYPEMAGFIHQLNQAEVAMQQQGFSEEMEPGLKAHRRTRFVNRLFPGL